MEPWYKVAIPRREVRDGRSFDPSEFAIALEQVVAKTAPEDYSDPKKFFSRTYFTRALTDHVGMVLRRLSGKTENTAPVVTLITQFGGGKTHTLTALYHLAESGKRADGFDGVAGVLSKAGLAATPEAHVGVFVGNAWDPADGRETPWIDIARQIGGDRGVAALGPSARATAPGTEAIGRVFASAGGPVLLLFDEVLNFLNRHRPVADGFYAFLQNLTVAMTGTTHGAAVISLPQSKVEMTAWDQDWQDRITKVVRRVAKDLISNDEAEISEVVRRRLFEDLGSERIRKNVATAYADWCFERRAQLPPEWTAVDTAATEASAREYLRARFERCYPFHPSTLSVFQRKWQPLAQFQRTRGTLAMLAQWISWASVDAFKQARREPVITLGSAPLQRQDFRAVVLGQLGEDRLAAALDADIAGTASHARALDADVPAGPLKDIHRRVGSAIFFESSGGQADKIAHLPELRFALGEPELDTTSIDNAANSLESRSFFIRRVGSDGYRVQHTPTLRKVVSDRRASLDEATEVTPAMRLLTQKEFDKGRLIPLVPFPQDGSDVQDSPRLTLVVLDPEMEWAGNGGLRAKLTEWTRQRGSSPRLYPGSLVWCVKKPGRDLRNKVEMWLAWKRVAAEINEGTLGGDFDRTDRADISASVRDAEEAARDEVWASYRYAVLSDAGKEGGLAALDLGAGHSSSAETLCGRVITALKSQGLLNESVGAPFLDRHWPPALKESGSWPLQSLRQSFLNGALTRLLDPDAVMRTKIVEFVSRGEFGLASGQKRDGTFERLWYQESVSPDDVAFDSNVFLLRKDKAADLRSGAESAPVSESGAVVQSGVPVPAAASEAEPVGIPPVAAAKCTIRVTGSIPPELWNKVGVRLITKLRSGGAEVRLGVEFSISLDSTAAPNLEAEVRQILVELGLGEKIRIESS